MKSALADLERADDRLALRIGFIARSLLSMQFISVAGGPHDLDQSGPGGSSSLSQASSSSSSSSWEMMIIVVSDALRLVAPSFRSVSAALIAEELQPGLSQSSGGEGGLKGCTVGIGGKRLRSASSAGSGLPSGGSALPHSSQHLHAAGDPRMRLPMCSAALSALMALKARAQIGDSGKSGVQGQLVQEYESLQTEVVGAMGLELAMIVV